MALLDPRENDREVINQVTFFVTSTKQGHFLFQKANNVSVGLE